MSLGGIQITRRGPEDAARLRRTTEREGRRARRRRAREQAPSLARHMDGMSSDDEVTEQQNLVFKQTKGNNPFFQINLYAVYSLHIQICLNKLFKFLGKLGLMSRLFGSIDSEEMKESRINQLEQKTKQSEEHMKQINTELT